MLPTDLRAKTPGWQKCPHLFLHFSKEWSRIPPPLFNFTILEKQFLESHLEKKSMKKEVRTACSAAGRLAAPQHSWQPNARRSPTRCAVALLLKAGQDPHSCATSSTFLHTEPNRRGHNHAHGSKIQHSLLCPRSQPNSFLSPSSEDKSKAMTTLCSQN